MDPNRDSRQAETGRISFEDWMRLTSACASKAETRIPEKSAVHFRRLLMRPLFPIAATLSAAAAVIAAIMLWQ